MDIHEYYKHTGALAQAAVAARVAEGRHPNVPPPGYRPDETWEEMGYVQLSMLFTHALSRRTSLEGLSKLCWRMGLRSRRGNRIGRSGVYAILTNPYYAGFIRYRGKLVRGSHKPMVSERLFLEVQESLRSRSKRLTEEAKEAAREAEANSGLEPD